MMSDGKQQSQEEAPAGTSTPASTEDEPTDTITNFLMNRQNCFLNSKTNTKHKDAQQYNAVVEFIKEKKCGVRSTTLDDFEKFIQIYSSLLWELDPHYVKIKQYAGKFLEVVEPRLLGFNDPKSHGHRVKNIDMTSLLSKMTTLTLYLERKFMQFSHMKPLEDVVSSVCQGICKYNEYLEAKKRSNAAQCEKVSDEDESSLEDFSVREVKRCDLDKPHVKHLLSLRSLLDAADGYTPINIGDNVGPLSRIETFRVFRSVHETGIPWVPANSKVFYFRLPSSGPHPVVHFIWKGDVDSKVSDGENARVMTSLRATQKIFYNRVSRKIVKKTALN